MRAEYPFNDGWLFAPHDLPVTAPDSDFEAVTLPHSNILLPHHNFDNAAYQFISTYRKRFTLPQPVNGRRVFIHFDGVMISSRISLNGRVLGEYDGGFTPFRYDITEIVRDDENVLHVRVDSTERADIPPYGYVVDYLTFGGIYRDVYLIYTPDVYIEDVFARGRDVLADAALDVDVTIRNASSMRRTVRAELQLYDHDDPAVEPLLMGITDVTEGLVDLPAGESATVTLRLEHLGNVTPWSLQNPKLYSVHTQIYERDLPADDHGAFMFGFREAVFKPDGFYLNGERIKLIGLNRHQTYPYIGAAAPARLQRKDADILKYELGINIVRTSHYPQSPHFLKRCDEIGLLVMEEIPGWQWIGDSDWKALSLRDVEAMIRRDRNHPSIVLWGVRINESGDDEAFYRATNALAHRLDPTRQTGGVRFFQESQFLEDVFTFNDFSNTIQQPLHQPHLVTEFNGHMFPTKSYDSEEHQVEHALRHARIQDKQLGMSNVVGAIGWCAFDYNTHREFGAGDRICYHGVSDIFRLPKFAAYFYESQIDPRVRPVLRAATFWTFGERAGAGVEPLVVFSNCDAIEVYKGGDLHGRFEPDRAQFPNLPHPPFIIHGFELPAMFGANYRDLRLVGFFDGQPVIEQRLSSDGVPHALTLEPDDRELRADGADMTRLVFRLVDRYGNRLPYCTVVVQFDLTGDAQIIGENPFPLVGGHAAVYLKAGLSPDVVTVRARVLTPFSVPHLSAETQIALTG